MPPRPPPTRPPRRSDSGLSSDQKKEVIRAVRGPVAERLRELVPHLAQAPNVYTMVIETPELLEGCIRVFRKQRTRFQDLLVDAAGQPVLDDETPLRCGRSINDIVGMVVRSGARAYSLKRFNDKPDVKPPVKPDTQNLLQKLASIIGAKWGKDEGPKGPKEVSMADRFYSAIKDNLEFDWQAALIPHYAELPIKLLIELGRGITALHNPEAITTLANIGRHNMSEAKKILSEPMMREMLDTQPLAAQGIAFLGKEKYDFLHGAVYDKMGEQFWQMCVDVDRLEAMETKNAKDLEELAPYLHIIGGETIDFMIQFLQHYMLGTFLDVAWDKLGEDTFRKVFGRGGKKSLIKKFCEKAAAFKLDPSDQKGDFARRLPDVFGAYMSAPDGFERGL